MTRRGYPVWTRGCKDWEFLYTNYVYLRPIRSIEFEHDLGK